MSMSFFVFFLGFLLGIVLANSLSGLICEIDFDSGWPLIFYIFGGVGIPWYIAWNYFVYNNPSVHPRISEKEKEYIYDTIGLDNQAKVEQLEIMLNFIHSNY